MAAISLFSMPKATKVDSPATGTGTGTSDGATGFAAMMADVVPQGAATQDAKGGKDGKLAKLSADTSDDDHDADADADPSGLDDIRDADKDPHHHVVQDDSAPSTVALFGIVVPPVVPNDAQGATPDGETLTSRRGDASLALSATVVADRSPRASDPTSDGETAALPSTGTDAAALAPMLAALTDTLAKGAAARRAEAAESTAGKAGIPLPPAGADDRATAPTKGAGPVRFDGDVTATAGNDSSATQLASIDKGAAVNANGKASTVLPASSPLPATAALLAARPATTGTDALKVEARKPAANAHSGEEGGADADAQTDLSGTPATATPVAAPLTASGDRIAPASPSVIDGAGQQLAAATADRQLDLARQGAWLDGISHDIAAAGASSGTVRFEIAPQHLGAVSVELRRDDNGAAVTLTTGSEAARSILTDATPQLLAEARAHGLHIANAQVDVGSGNAGSGGQSSPDSQGRPSGGQSDGRHAASQNASFSAQSGMGSDTGRQSQTRSQPLPEYRSGPARTDGGSVAEAKASIAVPATRSPDARYA